jgi:hypothetical protein
MSPAERGPNLGGAVFRKIGGLFGVGERNIQLPSSSADAGSPLSPATWGRVHPQGDLRVHTGEASFAASGTGAGVVRRGER